MKKSTKVTGLGDSGGLRVKTKENRGMGDKKVPENKNKRKTALFYCFTTCPNRLHFPLTQP
jgi:hypothetical protein